MEHKINEKQITFHDGSRLIVITVAGERSDHARTVYLTKLQAAFDAIQADEARLSGLCCRQLADNLGNSDRYPMLVYIGHAEFETRSPDYMKMFHPGADKPGFYKCWEAKPSPDNLSERETFLTPLDRCPFCHTPLAGVHHE